MKSYQSRMDFKFKDLYPYKQKEIWTQAQRNTRGRPCNHGHRGGRNRSTTPRIAGKHQKLKRKGPSLEPPEAARPC